MKIELYDMLMSQAISEKDKALKSLFYKNIFQKVKMQ
jgi:hypothetical protein